MIGQKLNTNLRCHPDDVWLVEEFAKALISPFPSRASEEGYQKLVIGTNKKGDYLNFKKSLEKSLQVWKERKERDQKMIDNGYLTTKKTRMQRYYERVMLSVGLSDTLKLEEYTDVITLLAARYVGGMKTLPKLGDIKCLMGITQPELANEVQAAFQKKIKELHAKHEGDKELSSKKKAEPQKRYEIQELIPLFNIQVGPQLFNSGFKIYYLDIFYSSRRPHSHLKKISSLSVEYRPKCKIQAKTRMYDISKSTETMFKRSDRVQADSYILYSDFSDSEERKILSNTLSSDEAKRDIVLLLPKETKLSPEAQNIISSYQIKTLREDEGINQIAIHICERIKKRIASSELWQEIYRDAFLDFDKFRNPAKDHIDYDEFMNMLNTKLGWEEFDPEFAKDFIKPCVKKMKTREDVIEVHFAIMSRLKKRLEEVNVRIGELEYKIKFPQKYTVTTVLNSADDKPQLMSEVMQLKETLEAEKEKKADLLQHLKYLKLTVLISEEVTEASQEKARKGR